MGAQMTHTRTRAIFASATFGLLVACGSNAMLPATQLFGPTMTMAFAQDETDAPLALDVISGLATDRPLSLTTDPIDL